MELNKSKGVKNAISKRKDWKVDVRLYFDLQFALMVADRSRQ